MQFTGILKEDLGRWWQRSWALLRPAAEMRGQMTAQSVYDGLQGGSLQLWVATDGQEMKAACVTEIAEWPGARECVVLLCGGYDVDQWLPFLGVIEAWAKAERCQRATIDGRAGWARKLPDYRPVSVVLSKELH
jgi:hypothetical protein